MRDGFSSNPAMSAIGLVRLCVGAALTSLLVTMGALAAPANAAPTLPSPGVRSADGSQLLAVSPLDSRQVTIAVRSAAMNRTVPLTVLLPRDRSAPRPTLYLLNGAGGGEDAASWERQTDVVSFFRDKNAFVVIPNTGAYSYYTNWQRPDPTLGVQKWSTFLGEELPQIVDSAFGTSRRNAVAGISSSGTSVLDLIAEHPGRFAAAGSYSGCVASSTPAGQAFVRLVVETRGGADARNMWGPYGGPGWRAHDAVLNAPRLRGASLYVSSGSGLPGYYDTPQRVRPGVTLPEQIGLGGPIEAATSFCTRQLQDRLAAMRIPATFHLPSTGTHSWGYWEDELHRSWPQFARVIGA